MASELKTLVKKRETVKGTVRLTHLDSILIDFNSVQEEIECHDPSEFSNTNEFERESFENLYYQSLSVAREILNESSPKLDITNNVKSDVITESTNVPEQGNLKGYKLPTMSLPTFAGEYDEWLNFRDTFTSVIHDNTSISNIQKFHYLKSTLKGDASSVIESIEVSNENYTIAWTLLIETFEDTARIKQKHVKALFELEPVVKDSYVSLKQLLNNSRKHIRSLKALEEPVDSWDTLLVYLISTKLDYPTKREWEKYKSEQNESPTLNDLESFLKQRKCNHKHNTLLHLEQTDTNTKRTEDTSSNVPSEAESSNINSQTVSLKCSVPKNISVLLPTAIVYIYDQRGISHTCRLLLDSASQSNFILQSLVEKLNIKPTKVNCPVSGIDPDFSEPSEIHLLIGAELFWQILCIGQFSCGENLPIAQKTHFGWVISGPIFSPQGYSKRHTTTCCCITETRSEENTSLRNQLASFWEVEELNNSTTEIQEDIFCEQFYCKTTTFNESGRFIVRLPFKSNTLALGESYTSTDSKENAAMIINQVNELLASSGFPLRKWASSDPSILSNLSCASGTIQFSNNSTVKTLGLSWNPELDQFTYPLKLETTSSVTKRTILSTEREFTDDIKQIKQEKSLKTSSRLLALNPFLDEHTVTYSKALNNLIIRNYESLVWIPGHSDQQGNKIADSIARKEATTETGTCHLI
ncbi:hypothetical protein NQ317_003836 [Molorchus minor]|uniref:Peptidase aspartic putative domain-containing protein n=1 Tax=Molorchus minor TaxID=1323400 RepID=A0ABQ9IS90_9CUCU|nr:hypothetical protein NQ317_003836 [Molorchus minor]